MKGSSASSSGEIAIKRKNECWVGAVREVVHHGPAGLLAGRARVGIIFHLGELWPRGGRKRPYFGEGMQDLRVDEPRGILAGRP